MCSDYTKGDLVRNQEKQSELGVLIKPEDAHPHFWKVLSVNGLESWFEFNLKKLEDYNDAS